MAALSLATRVARMSSGDRRPSPLASKVSKLWQLCNGASKNNARIIRQLTGLPLLASFSEHDGKLYSALWEEFREPARILTCSRFSGDEGGLRNQLGPLPM